MIQAFFHELQGLAEKGKELSVIDIVHQGSIGQGHQIGGVGQQKDVPINPFESLNNPVVLNVGQAGLVDFKDKVRHGQRLNNRVHLGGTGVADKEHPLAQLLGENFDQLVILTVVTVIENQPAALPKLHTGP